jgi:HEAT repeat protein
MTIHEASMVTKKVMMPNKNNDIHSTTTATAVSSILSELSPSFERKTIAVPPLLSIADTTTSDTQHNPPLMPFQLRLSNNENEKKQRNIDCGVRNSCHDECEGDDGDGEEYEDDMGMITKSLHDLLPPCSYPGGDATVAFFRACLGEDRDHQHNMETKNFMSRSGGDDANESIGGVSHEVPNPPPLHASIPSTVSTFSTSRSLTASGVTSVFSSMFRRSASSVLDNHTTPSTEVTTAATSTSSIASNSESGGPSTPNRSFANVFRKRTNNPTSPTKNGRVDDHGGSATDMLPSKFSGSWVTGNVGGNWNALRPGEYVVRIDREQLGLTVENVLERTVVRTVLPGGPAKRAGAKVGALIVKVGNVETKYLTHFETIDELRRSQRPLQLILRQLSDDDLRMAREEMGRLIRGSGFGYLFEGIPPLPMQSDQLDRINTYTDMIRRRLCEMRPAARNKTDEAVSRAGEKLVWILILFVIGLEREASRLFSLARKQSNMNDGSFGETAMFSPNSKRGSNSMYHHTARDYADAARSVARVLLDYIRKKLDHEQTQPGPAPILNPPPAPPLLGKGRGGRAGRFPSGIPSIDMKSAGILPQQKPLLQIGDVLQRTRTFLADTSSPPAALLRGELISLLCDVLDVDTEMELLEEEPSSASGGATKGTVNDLGSAGSLLKLLILNCHNMRSPDCKANVAQNYTSLKELQDEMQRRFGRRPDKFTAHDLHRLHAGNRFLAVVHRLAASRSTSARISACSLGTVIWNYLDFPHQLQLRGVITRALHDVEVIVRKSIAHVLHEIAELVYDPRSVTWLVLMCERAMTDPEPQLRSAAMTLTWHLAEHLPNAFLGDASQGSRYLRRLPDRSDPIFPDVYLLQCKLLPVATRLAEDRSPAVRLAVASQCDRLCDALGAHWSSVVIDVLLALLSDSDERVRCEAILCVPRLCKIVMQSMSRGRASSNEVSILDGLMPSWMKLQTDVNSTVRVSLATAAGEMLTLMVALQIRLDVENSNVEIAQPIETDKRFQRQVDDRLIPLVQTLLNDRDPEVTSAALRAVSNASRSSAHGGQNRGRHLSTASEDDTASISSHHSHLSRERVDPVLMPVLSEQQVLRLLPTLTDLSNSKQWRVRQSAVEIVPALLGCTNKHDTREEISKLCVKLMNDHVDAVRRTAAECLCMGGSALGSHGEGASSAEWFGSIVLPRLRECSIHQESKQRLLCLRMVETILLNGTCPSYWTLSSSSLPRLIGKQNSLDEADEASGQMNVLSPIREILVITLSLSLDSIANVRLNVGRTLETVVHLIDDEDLAYIQAELSQQVSIELSRDASIGGSDRDVLYFARCCLNKIRSILDDRNAHGSTIDAPITPVIRTRLDV